MIYVEEREALCQEEITQAHCNECGHSTKHDILASDKKDWKYWEGPGEEGDDGYDLREMLKCRGCGSVKLRLTTQYPNDGPPTVVFSPLFDSSACAGLDFSY